MDTFYDLPPSTRPILSVRRFVFDHAAGYFLARIALGFCIQEPNDACTGSIKSQSVERYLCSPTVDSCSGVDEPTPAQWCRRSSPLPHCRSNLLSCTCFEQMCCLQAACEMQHACNMIPDHCVPRHLCVPLRRGAAMASSRVVMCASILLRKLHLASFREYKSMTMETASQPVPAP